MTAPPVVNPRLKSGVDPPAMAVRFVALDGTTLVAVTGIACSSYVPQPTAVPITPPRAICGSEYNNVTATAATSAVKSDPLCPRLDKGVAQYCEISPRHIGS